MADVDAIRACHRGIRQAMADRDGAPSLSPIGQHALGRIEAYLDVLAILRPGMTTEQVLAAALRRLDEAS